jgi:GNAT superfamily N-acetyltransferase
LSVRVRPAALADAPLILQFIRALAEYERLLQHVVADEAAIRATLFCDNPRVFCEIAEMDGAPAGFALWFYSYSTFTGSHGIWLEDLFVDPERRGAGAGKALLARLARRCAEEGLGRLEWNVLNWNEPSIGFYRALGAEPQDQWTTYRLAGEALTRLASRAG